MLLKDFLTNNDATDMDVICLVAQMLGEKEPLSLEKTLEVLWNAEKKSQRINSILKKIVSVNSSELRKLFQENPEEYLSAFNYWSGMHEYQKDVLFSKEVNLGLRQNYLKIQEIKKEYGS